MHPQLQEDQQLRLQRRLIDAGWNDGGYGNYVVVSHADGMSTLYAHLATVSVSYGQSVSTGTVVGTVGSTGWSTGFHLHFGVMKNGAFVNPAPYLGI